MGEAQKAERSRRLGHFDVLGQVAEGGMGVLHLARQPELDRLVVLKRMRRDLVGDRSMVARFEREARAAAAVQHQNVVAVYDCFQHRGDHYIAQEYVDGIDVAGILGRTGRVDARIAARIALGVALGLEEVHSRGIVHRDLKPSNVLVGFTGEVKVADFGIAVERSGPGLTQPGLMLGSLPYMSPEQMMGEQVDYRTDLFSFGIVLYEMLTGQPPFRVSEEGAPDTLLERIQRGKFDSPGRHADHVPGWMVRLIRRCLRPRPADRIQTATVLRRTIERRVRPTSPSASRREIAAWLAGHEFARNADSATTLRPLATPGSTRHVARRLVWTSAIAATLGVASVVVAVRVGLPRDDAPPPETPSESATPVTARGPVTDTVATAGDVAVEAGQTNAAATEAPPHEIATPADAIDSETTPRDADTTGAPPVEPVQVAIVPPAPARIRFVAQPWARITIDDEDPFWTPRAGHVELAPGTHSIVFEHPSLGRAEVVLELEAGEQRTVRHVFDDPQGAS